MLLLKASQKSLAKTTPLTRFIVLDTSRQREGKKQMASPLEIYNEWQSRQMARDVEHLGEVVDLVGFRDICIGLSGWTTGYEAAFENLTRNILIPLADLHMTVEEIVEGKDAF